MDPNIGNKGSSPKNRSTKELHIWSPRNKNLPHISATIDASSKHQLDLANTSPSGGGSTRGGRAYKVAPVRLIPLSNEGRGKENLVGNTKSPNFNSGFDASNKFEPSHLTIIVHNRPNSEQCPNANASDKLTQKLHSKPYTNWLERNFKIPNNPSSPASINDNDLNNASIKSKFKSKLLTARVTEEDIAKQFKRNKNAEGVYKDPTLNEHSINLNLKKSGMSLTLMKNSDLPPSYSKTLDGPIEKSVLLADNYKEVPVIESTLLNSSKTSKRSPSLGGKEKNSPNKDTPEKIIKQASFEKNIFQGEAPEIQQPQPKKLFQKKDAQVAPSRVPMLFAKKIGSPSPANLFKPNTPLLGAQVSIAKTASPDFILDDQNNKEKEESNNIVEQLNSATVKRKISIKKEYFHGEIRGSTLKWKMGDFIGSGNFGQVYRGMEVESGKIIAVKIIPSSNSANKDIVTSFEMELNILQKLKHKHIVQYLGHETFDNSLHIYLEYMSGGNITNILSKYGALPEKTVKVYAKQILAGLIYLHENKVVHKDIKGANILVDGDGTVKLADFGCSTQFEKTLSNFDSFLANTIQGSIPWMAPEVVKETGYGRRSDIWSFGCTILEMATGKLPWSHYLFDNPVAVLMKIATSDEIPLIPETLSEDLKSFLSLCLQRDPTKRPHAQDLIIHPFLTNN